MSDRRRNVNRAYMNLRVWQHAQEYFRLTCRAFARQPHVLSRVAAQQIASADSVHRNIAEGNCRRSVREYLQHVNIALGSIGESVSGLCACREAGQIEQAVHDELDGLAYKLENGLLRLRQSLERMRDNGTWNDRIELLPPSEGGSGTWEHRQEASYGQHASTHPAIQPSTSTDGNP